MIPNWLSEGKVTPGYGPGPATLGNTPRTLKGESMDHLHKDVHTCTIYNRS